MQITHSLFRAALLLCAACAGGAYAQDAQPTASQAAAQDVAQQAAPEVDQSVSLFGVPLQAGQLDSYRGGFDVVKNDMQLGSAVTGNSAVNVLSGNNSIADGAFTNASGLPMVIQNSGSNVSIQNATIVNVQLK